MFNFSAYGPIIIWCGCPEPKAYYFAYYRKSSTFVAVKRCALVTHALSAWELKGNQVQILNSTRCCESSIQVPPIGTHVGSHIKPLAKSYLTTGYIMTGKA